MFVKNKMLLINTFPRVRRSLMTDTHPIVHYYYYYYYVPNSVLQSTCNSAILTPTDDEGNGNANIQSMLNVLKKRKQANESIDRNERRRVFYLLLVIFKDSKKRDRFSFHRKFPRIENYNRSRSFVTPTQCLCPLPDRTEIYDGNARIIL